MAVFPDRFLRGLRKQDDITHEGLVNSQAFYPDFSKPRIDGAVETSINWEDDSGAIPFTLQRIDQSQYGLAVLQRAVFDDESSKPPIYGAITYVRSPENGNPYHGDVIYPGNLGRQVIKMFAAVLALRSTRISRTG